MVLGAADYASPGPCPALFAPGVSATPPASARRWQHPPLRRLVPARSRRPWGLPRWTPLVPQQRQLPRAVVAAEAQPRPSSAAPVGASRRRGDRHPHCLPARSRHHRHVDRVPMGQKNPRRHQRRGPCHARREPAAPKLRGWRCCLVPPLHPEPSAALGAEDRRPVGRLLLGRRHPADRASTGRLQRRPWKLAPLCVQPSLPRRLCGAAWATRWHRHHPRHHCPCCQVGFGCRAGCWACCCSCFRLCHHPLQAVSSSRQSGAPPLGRTPW